MELAVFCLLLFFNVLTIIKVKRLLNYLSVFSAIWAVMVLFAKIRLFGLNETSRNAYFVADLGILSFALAYFLLLFSKTRIRMAGASKEVSAMVSIRKRLVTDDLKSLKGKKLINFPVFLVLFIFVFGSQLVFLRRAMSILSSGSFQAIHYAIRHVDESGLITNKLEKLVDMIIIQPFVYAIIPISLIALFSKIKHYRTVFFLSTISAVMHFFSHAGRIIIVDYIFYLMFLVSMFGVSVSKKTKRRLLVLILAALGGIILITASRRGMTISKEFIRDNFFREVYDYFAIPLPQMSYWMDRAQSTGTYTYGIGFFNGLIELPLRVLEKVGLNISGYENLISIFGDTEQIYTNAAFHDKSYNAFVTAFFFFFVDFRYVGVTMGSLVFGAVAGAFERNYDRKTFVHFAIYLMFLQCIIRSFARWQPYQFYYLMSFFFVVIISYRTLNITIEY